MTDERIGRVRQHTRAAGCTCAWVESDLASLERELTELREHHIDHQCELVRTVRELTEWKDQAKKNLASRDEWSIQAHEAERELTRLRSERDGWKQTAMLKFEFWKDSLPPGVARNLVSQRDAAREVVEAARAHRHAVREWLVHPSVAMEQAARRTGSALDTALSHYDEAAR